METTYNEIGRTYSLTRRSDPWIAKRIHQALGSARTVLNVGAGTGSYEPTDRSVVAAEPSAVMIAQRGAGPARVVQATAEALPFRSRSFDATMSVLSTHHWTDLMQGLAELRRVARQRVVILTYDVSCIYDLWVCDYFPFIGELDRGRFAPIEQMAAGLGGASVLPLPIAADCTDGLLAAFWKRPEAYLDPLIRAGMSSFAVMPADQLDRGLQRLSQDLASGAWATRYAHLLALDELECGYRLLVAQQ